MTTAFARTRVPPSISIAYGFLSQESRFASFAIISSAPNFSACVSARDASSWPEMPVGNPR